MKLSVESKRKISANHADFSGVNNPMYGKKHSSKTIDKMRKSHIGKNNAMYGVRGKDSPIFGSKNPMWIQGVPKKYRTLHYRIESLYGKASVCENLSCSKKSKKFAWSNKRHDYKTSNRKDWQQLCYRCHNEYDKTLKK